MADMLYFDHQDEGGWGVAPDDTVLRVLPGNAQVVVSWSQAEKTTTAAGQVVCHTKGVMIRRATDAAPATEWDGDLVVNSAEMSGSYTDAGLTNKATYFYKAFPYSTNLVYNRGGVAKEATPDEAAALVVTFTASAARGREIKAIHGDTTQTAIVESDGTATFKLFETGEWIVGGRPVTVRELGEQLSMDGHMLAFTYSEKDPNPASVSYPAGYDNSGFTAPFAMNLSTGVPNYGDWDPSGTNASKIKFLFPKSCMLKYDGTRDYYLNENDETKKEDGSASDVASSTYGGNAMMEWAQEGSVMSWIITPDSEGTGFTFELSNMIIGDLKPWNHYNANGRLSKHFYTPKYFGASDGTRLRSISGMQNYVSNTRNSEASLALANNTDRSKPEWYTEVLSDRILLMMLCYMLGKSLNTQAAFGYGRCASGNNSAIGIGTMNGKGMFYGVSNQTSGVKVFGMENPWGNLWRGTAGLINANGTIKYKITYGTQDGSTATGYNFDGTGYKTMPGTMAGTSGGYISHMGIAEDAVLPVTMSGSDSTYYTDGAWFNNGQVDYALFGGYWDNALRVGAACCDLGGAASLANAVRGSALSCKPLAEEVNAA